MSYTCDLCHTIVPPRQGMLRHVVTRLLPKEKRTEIDREYKVCQGCKLLLDGGTPLRHLIIRPKTPPVVVPPPRQGCPTLVRRPFTGPTTTSKNSQQLPS